jgi:hypothetical protein
MTNEEWLCQLSTEEKASMIANGGFDLCSCCTYWNDNNSSCHGDRVDGCGRIVKDCYKGIVEWLKQERSEI